MCVSKGAPLPAGRQTEKQQGMQELWDFLKARNAVFVGDDDLAGELKRFLENRRIRRGKATERQKLILDKVIKAVEAMP